MNEYELEKYIASLIIQQSNQKDTSINTCDHEFDKKGSINKRFLENTIRNSKSYNELFKNNRNLKSNRKRKERGIFSAVYNHSTTKSRLISLPDNDTRHNSKMENSKEFRKKKELSPSFNSDSNSFLYNGPVEPKLNHISALVNHAKLNAKSKPKSKPNKDAPIIKDIFGCDVEEGVYGPLPRQNAIKIKITDSELTRLNNGLPSSVLPEKCPWW